MSASHSNNNNRDVRLLVSNMHCPSCCDGIRSLLSPLKSITGLSVDLIQRTVRFNIPLEIPDDKVSAVVEEVAEKLYDQGGYYVVGHAKKSRGKGRVHNIKGPRWSDIWTNQRESKEERRIREEDEEEETRRKKHLERCLICQEEERVRRERNGSSSKTLALPPALPLEKSDDATLEIKEENAPAKDTILKTLLSIEGMTCASCTSSITNALSSETGVQTVEVNLLASSATIVHSSLITPESVADLVEEVGFAASVLSSSDISSTATTEKTANGEEQIFDSTFSIEGMTCASCSSSISQVLSDLDGMIKIEIDVLGNKGLFRHSAALDTATIADAIEDTGFSAELISSIPSNQTKTKSPADGAAKDGRRSIDVRVKGIYCSNCISQLNSYLASLPLVAYTPFVLGKPTSSLTYIPQKPLTIRHILNGLSDVAPEFSAEIVKVESLNSRSQRLQKKELKHLIGNLILAVLIAIPTFIIAIVGMVLASSHSTFRMVWMQSVWGAANLGTIVLWPLATIVQFGVGRIFYARAFHSIWPHIRRLLPSKLSGGKANRNRKHSWRSFFSFGSMALSTSVSYFASLAMLILDVRAPQGTVSIGTYFDSCVFLIMFILLGRTLEAYAKSKTTDAISLLGELRPESALLIQQHQSSSPSSPTSGKFTPEEEDKSMDGPLSIPVDHIEIGDWILIPPGSLPPTDGVIVSGSSTFDESSLTGESKPITKSIGDEIFTGTTNISGAITIQTTNLGGETMLSKIITAVSDASAKKAPIEKLAERLTGVFVPIIIYIALAVLAIWLGLSLSGSVDARSTGQGGRTFFAIEFAVAVLVIACPCGIGLAVPCAIAVGNGLAAKAGILASGGGEAWVGATRVATVVFDKTGTLTMGKSTVTDEIYPKVNHLKVDEIKAMVKMVEETSTHPLANGLVDHLKSSDASQTSGTIISNKEIRGRGLSANLAKRDQQIEIIIGNLALMHDHNVDVSSANLETIEQWSHQSKSVILVAIKHQDSNSWNLAAMYALSDPPRPETAETIRKLKENGCRVMMLSGDNGTTANAVAKVIGIPSEDVRAGVGPEGKAEVIREVQSELAVKSSEMSKQKGIKFPWNRNKSNVTGGTVMFVGDGLNDSVALAAADVSVAMGHGSQATMASADFVLLNSSLSTILSLTHLAKRIRNRQMLNLGWAIMFNVICIPIAAGVIYPAHGIRLSPVWSAVLMALSSVSVVASSLALRWGL